MSTEYDTNMDTADILIVDDDSANLKLLSEMLVSQGYRVRPSNSPRIAIESAFSRPPDLMLLDIRMPAMDGFEVCASLKQDERTRDIPILFISALQDTRDKVRAFEAGGVDFITKPFQEEEVLARVQTHLKLSSMQRNLEKMVAERTAELTKSEQLARSLLNATTNLTHLIDEDGMLLDLNDAVAAILDGTREELIGTCVYDFFPAEAAETRRGIVRQALAEGKPIRYIDRLRPDKVFDTGVYPVEAPAGEKGRVVIYAQDITDRQRAEEELSQIFSMSLDLLCIADLNSLTFLKVNPRFTEVLGYSEKELLEKPYLHFIHPEDVEATLAVIEQKLKMGTKVINFDNRYRCKDGSYRWLSWAAHPKPGKDITYSVARDITEWKQNQEALKKSKEILDATGRMARVGGWELDADTMAVTWTEETCRIHETPPGYKPILQEAINFFHPEERKKLTHAIQRSLDYGEPYDLEIRFITARGNHLWTRTICQPEMIDGKTVKLKGTFQDITGRKEMEQTLKENEEKLRNAQEIARLGYWEWDIDKNQLSLSDEMYRIYGIDPGTPVTFDDLADRVHPDDQEYRRQLLADLFDGKTIPSFSYRIIRPDGSVRFIYGIKLLEFDDHGNPSRTKGTLQDVTEIKTVEMAYRDSEAQLKKARSEAMSLRLEMAHLNRIMTMNELAASFAHELNQPLGAITNNASVGKMLNSRTAEGTEEFDEILDDIVSDAQRAGQIIRKLRDIMKKGDAVYTSVDINQLLDEVIALYRNSFSLDRVTVVTEKDPGLFPVKGDKIRLQQVLMNLITNATEAMEDSPQKRLEFKTFHAEGMVKVSISDTGPGIEESAIGQIFDPFFTTKSEGMGIGLRLCRSIIEEHGGRIWAENNRDAGTTFYFTLKVFSGEQHREPA